MRHAGKFVFVEQALHQRRIADVALHELDAAIGDQRLQAADIGRIGHGIDHDQAVGRPRGAPCVHQVLADEARAAGDQNALHRTSGLSCAGRWSLEEGKTPRFVSMSTALARQTCGLPPAAKPVIFAASVSVIRCYFLPNIVAYLVNEGLLRVGCTKSIRTAGAVTVGEPGHPVRGWPIRDRSFVGQEPSSMSLPAGKLISAAACHPARRWPRDRSPSVSCLHVWWRRTPSWFCFMG